MRNRLIAVVLVIFGIAATGAAQTTTAILGTVLDSNSAVISGATVTVTSAATGFTRTMETTSGGEFNISPLQPGTYTLTVDMKGFEGKKISDIVLRVDQLARYDVVLSVGTVTSEVEVTATAPLLNTETATIGDVVDSNKVVQLPLNGRQFLQLALLAPGVTIQPGGSSDGPIIQTGPILNVDGSRPTHNAFSLDGVTTTDYYFNHLTMSTSVDAIQEFKVISGIYSAEYGFKDGGHISVITRSGGNQYHGSAFEFLRNSDLDAKNFFDSKTAPIPEYRLNQFGGSLGGPIIKDKTQFFVNYEGQRIRQGITKTASVPTAAMRAGDFTGLPTIYDPLTRAPFLNNMIPSNRIDNAAKVLLSVVPLPNLPGLTNNFVSSPIFSQTADQFDTRVDHQFSSSDSIFGRFSYANISAINPFNGQGATQLPGSPTLVNTYGRNAVFSYVHVFKPTIVNQLVIGFNRVSGGFNTTNQGLNLTAAAGLQGLENLPEILRGVPTVNTTQFSSWGDEFFQINRNDNTFQYTDTLSINIGSHSLRVGGEIYRQQFNSLVPVFPRGNISYSGIFTSPTGTSATGGSGFADFLLGYPASGTAGVGDPFAAARSTWFSAFVQDDWRATRKLTLNLGLRYERTGPYTDVFNEYANFDQANGQLIIACNSNGTFGRGANPAVTSYNNLPLLCNQAVGWNNSLLTTDNKNFAPRVGLAYQVMPSLVVRAGYGIFYGLNPLNNQAFMDRNTPFEVNLVPINATGVLSSQTLTTETLFGTTNGSNGINAVAHNLHNALTQQWNAALEKQFGNSFVVSATYVGVKSERLDFLPNINIPTGGATALATAQLNALRPYPNLPSLPMATSDGMSSYNALELRADHRIAHGLLFSANFTWAHALDDASGSAGVSGDGSIKYGLNPYSQTPGLTFEDLTKGDSAFDVRKRFVSSVNYDLPFGKGKYFLHDASRPVDLIVGGWRAGGIVTMSDGRHFNVGEPSSSLNNTASGYPNLICDPNLPGSQRNPASWFNTACFATPVAGTLGNEPRNFLIGPGINNVDFTLAKDTAITESKALEFRAEMFNIANHPQFDIPGNTIGSSTLRISTVAFASRQIQFGLKFLF